MQNDHWNVPIGDLLIPLVTGIHRCQARPEALLLGRRSLLRLNSSSNTLNLDPGIRRGFQVKPPGGMAHRAAIGSHQCHVASIHQIKQRHCTLLATPSSCGGEQQYRDVADPPPDYSTAASLERVVYPW